MRLHAFFLAIAVAAVGFVPGLAAATIDVFPKETVLDSRTTTVQIVNNGDRPEYVTISLSRWLNPGVPLKDEKLEPVGEEAQPTLVAFPFKLSLAPGQTKRIIVKSLKAVQNETVYRLDVKPSIKAMTQGHQTTAGTVVVNFGFSTLVRQMPERESAKLSVVCDAQGARLTATGTVRYLVKGAKVDGEITEPFNVYPGVPQTMEGRVVEIPEQKTCRGGEAPVSAGASETDHR
ncbi:pilus assembly protein [Burkholderia lata]|uniref:hypothetical protein n=1 Tax=Burkholderia lata (strain ATCC 17760 / DSM 23089 / LMG 22485 / NCIMB 9086 / R18194 / 383) TaxID=482957 RepID=UPI0014549B1C|nr:hypothetical protein [Burkholderia lata]VWB31288.1 pilus assembly protein [Burkholderia lata]